MVMIFLSRRELSFIRNAKFTFLFLLAFLLSGTFSFAGNKCGGFAEVAANFPGGGRLADRPIKEGEWRAVLDIGEGKEIPFRINVKKMGFSYAIEIINGEERIMIDEFSVRKDSAFITMPVFGTEFRIKNLGDSLRGVWINSLRKEKNILPFRAKLRGGSRFLKGEVPGPATTTTNWQCLFDYDKQPYPAHGVFGKKGNYLSGTFLTETGDYRFLEGYDDGKEVKMSGFDGSHAYLFTANYISADSLEGTFYSGIHHSEKWKAKRNDTFKLPDPETLTYLKPGYETISFSFPNLQGQRVSLSDPKYKGKVVIVQLLGSWCANCMDETAFLTSLHNQYKEKGLEVIGLAFERADSAKSVKNVQRLKSRYMTNYEFLITGKSNSAGASEVLPMLNKVMAFPTTIIIDKKGKVRKIHTGFSGPGTGEHYNRYVESTRAFVEKLLKEKR